MSVGNGTPQGTSNNGVIGCVPITPPVTGIIDILSGGLVTTGPSPFWAVNSQATSSKISPNLYTSIGASNMKIDTSKLHIVHTEDMNTGNTPVLRPPITVMLDHMVAQNTLPPSKWPEIPGSSNSGAVYSSRTDPFQEIINNHGAFEKRIHRGDARCLETAFQYYLTGHSVRVLVGHGFMFEDEEEVFFPPIELLFDSLLTEEPKIKVPAPFAQISKEDKTNKVRFLRNGFEYRRVNETFSFDQVNEYLMPPDNYSREEIRPVDPHSRNHNSWSPSSTTVPERMQVFEGLIKRDILSPVATRSLFNNETSAQDNLHHFEQDGFLYFVAPSTISQHISPLAMALMCRYDGEKSDNNLWS